MATPTLQQFVVIGRDFVCSIIWATVWRTLGRSTFIGNEVFNLGNCAICSVPQALSGRGFSFLTFHYLKYIANVGQF